MATKRKRKKRKSEYAYPIPPYTTLAAFRAYVKRALKPRRK